MVDILYIYWLARNAECIFVKHLLSNIQIQEIWVWLVVYIILSLFHTYLVGFACVWYKYSSLPPAVALVAADRPEQHVGCGLAALSPLFDV